jgi:hypothetical protein
VHLTAHRYHLAGDDDKLNWLVLSVFKIGIFNIDCTLKAFLQFHVDNTMQKSGKYLVLCFIFTLIFAAAKFTSNT